jgi:signal transduction histidine kinase
MGRTEVVILLIISIFVFAVLIAGVAMLLFRFRKKTMEYETERILVEQAHQQELLSVQMEMQQQTMQHIGQEIHDDVGQKLTLAALYTQQLGYQNRHPDMTGPLESIGQIINESLAKLRDLSKDLTDNYLQTASLEELMRQECDKIQGLGICTVQVTFTGPMIEASILVKTILIRLLQEFMQNSLKHARCATITAQLANEAEGLRLALADDGVGFVMDSGKRTGIGLLNMQKRAAMIGATLEIRSQPQRGTQLLLFLPENKLNQ